MYLPKTYKPYKKRTCLLRTDGVIRVFTFSRPKSHRVQCKLDPFSARRLASNPLTTLNVCRHEWSAHAHKFAAPRMLSYGCYRRKKVYLLNIWRPIVHVLFQWPHPGWCRHVCMDGLYKLSKFQLNRMNSRRVIRGQSFSLMRPPPIGMKLVPDKRSAPMTPLGQVPKIYRPFFELWPLKVDIC